MAVAANKEQYVVSGQEDIFVASNQAAQALSTALSTTQTGLTLTNPVGSGVNLIVLAIDIAIATAAAGVATIVAAANVNPLAAAVTQTTPLTVRNAKLGNSSAASGLAASAVTLPAAPVVVLPLGGPVAASSLTPDPIHVAVDGRIVLEQGTALSINSLTTAVSVIAAITWSEVPAFS